MGEPIRVAVAGVGNCASSLFQGIAYYRRRLASEGVRETLGLMHYDLGGYLPGDIACVCAFDIDERKVGRPLEEAVFAPPNCTKRISDLEPTGVMVRMGPILDGYPSHMAEFPENRRFMPAKKAPVDVAAALRESAAEILLNYLPVGSQKAVECYAEACLAAGVSLVNCMPVFIASDKAWAKRFTHAGIPIVGDDVKAQVGATIVHRTLVRLFRDRGAVLDATYQLNTGGNTDFLNMLERERLGSKKISKTEAVQAELGEDRLPDEQIHIGPADYVPWQRDNKVCFLRMEGRGFAGVPLNLELRLSVEDSPNSAGVAIDAVRCCRLARDRGIAGPLTSTSACLMKHPPEQMSDTEARAHVDEFIAGKRER